MTLADFETLVLTQQPASVPWEPVTDYSFEARKTIEGDHPRLICDHLVECEDADILDVGCGPGHLVRLLTEESCRRGWQLSVAGCDKSDQTGHSWFFQRDVTDSDDVPATVWDVVICREVLEHLTVQQIHRAVTTLCRLSAQYVYVTTRFHPNPASLLDVATSDGLDPTHISMLNQDFLRVLFVLEGFKRRADLEAQMDWQQKGRVLVYERAA